MSVLNVKNAKRPRTLLNPGPLAFSRPAPAGLVLCSESAWESLPKGAKAGSAVSRTPWSKSRVQTGSANIQKRAGQSAERNQSSKADKGLVRIHGCWPPLARREPNHARTLCRAALNHCAPARWILTGTGRQTVLQTGECRSVYARRSSSSSSEQSALTFNLIRISS